MKNISIKMIDFIAVCCDNSSMGKKPETEIELSDVMKKALNDLDKAVLEFEIEDANVRRIKGTWTFHMRNPGSA